MKKALLSVSDKRGLVEFARGLEELAYELIATGGTFKVLDLAGLEPIQVSNITSFPEILDGRVKSLHPRIHAGILAKRNQKHLAEIKKHSISPIDIVVSNLYPFKEAIKNPDISIEEALENIDIGGPTMIRAAAKNYQNVLVITSPDDYQQVLEALKAKQTDSLRKDLARKAFAHTASYDAAIANWFNSKESLPASLHLSLSKNKELRYGENPHQQAGLYTTDNSFWSEIIQHKGSSLSYLNIYDAQAAWQLVAEFNKPCCAIIKHANPCGLAIANNIQTAYKKAFAGDPLSAFGGVIALNQEIDKVSAEAIMANHKADVLIATSYTKEALKILKAKRKSMRVLEANKPTEYKLEIKQVGNDYLVQNPDQISADRANWRVVTKAKPSQKQWQDLEMAYIVCTYTKSNAIVLIKDNQAIGVGAGQQSRVDAVELASKKAGAKAINSSLASDAFFPFRDGLDAAAKAGVKAVIQPGGSIRDEELIAAADEHGIAMVFSGKRHFKH